MTDKLKDPLGTVAGWRAEEAGLSWWDEYRWPLVIGGCAVAVVVGIGLLVVAVLG